MPVVLGLFLGYLVIIYIWALAGPIIALLNLVCGRFFIASVLMAISLYCGTGVWDDLVVTPDEYKVLLGFGLVLEGVKWGVKWWNRGKVSEPKLEETAQTEFYAGTHRRDRLEGDMEVTLPEDVPLFDFLVFLARVKWKGDVVVNVKDDKPPMKDITPKVRRLLR